MKIKSINQDHKNKKFLKDNLLKMLNKKNLKENKKIDKNKN